MKVGQSGQDFWNEREQQRSQVGPLCSIFLSSVLGWFGELFLRAVQSHIGQMATAELKFQQAAPRPAWPDSHNTAAIGPRASFHLLSGIRPMASLARWPHGPIARDTKMANWPEDSSMTKPLLFQGMEIMVPRRGECNSKEAQVCAHGSH